MNPDQLEAALSLIPGCISFKNLQGQYEYCNEDVIRSAHLERKNDIIGKTDATLWPILSETIRKNDLKVISTGQALQLDEAVMFNDHRLQKFFSIKSPIKDKQNKVTGVIINSIEINSPQYADMHQVVNQSIELYLQKMHFKRYYFSTPLGNNYLTKREAACLFCLSRGLSNKAIASYLKISPRTVETHMENIKNKTLCSNRAELTELVFRENFFTERSL